MDRWAGSTDGGLGEAPRGNILIGLRMRRREDIYWEDHIVQSQKGCRRDVLTMLLKK